MEESELRRFVRRSLTECKRVLEAVESVSCSTGRQTDPPLLETSTFPKLFSVYLSLLDEHWSESVRLHAIAALSLFINMITMELLGRSGDYLTSKSSLWLPFAVYSVRILFADFVHRPSEGVGERGDRSR
ncbi:hypothetical protein KIN20_022233 [Parelaphostrongylus tenuis]|uniref:Uncharacterized protein n=1 Tax=Parelaphostrongylus tenuis TaxID=148309 RepID=A0AAD5N5F0_PARTN|nr:hypothetical protein KIN20_022233 [Parelaphostrongylus tenuis]